MGEGSRLVKLAAWSTPAAHWVAVSQGEAAVGGLAAEGRRDGARHFVYAAAVARANTTLVSQRIPRTECGPEKSSEGLPGRATRESLEHRQAAALPDEADEGVVAGVSGSEAGAGGGRLGARVELARGGDVGGAVDEAERQRRRGCHCRGGDQLVKCWTVKLAGVGRAAGRHQLRGDGIAQRRGQRGGAGQDEQPGTAAYSLCWA